MDYNHPTGSLDSNVQREQYNQQFLANVDTSQTNANWNANGFQGYYQNTPNPFPIDPQAHKAHLGAENFPNYAYTPVDYTSSGYSAQPYPIELNSIDNTTSSTAQIGSQQEQVISEPLHNSSPMQTTAQEPEPSKMATSVTQANVSNTNSLRRQRRPRVTPHAEKTQSETDAYTQWYQMMMQYYSQFYPGYGSSMPSQSRPDQGPLPNNQAFARNKPASSSFSQRSNTTSRAISIPTHMPMVQPVRSDQQHQTASDYAAAYYRYYYYHQQHQQGGAGLWMPPQMGMPVLPARLTPHCYASPHIRAFLGNPGLLVQVLPNRPSDGELARIELVDLGELANQSLAQATQMATQLPQLPGGGRESSYSLAGSSDNQDSLGEFNNEAQQQMDDERRACTAIALAWDRADHSFFPGPLLSSDTMKADVLVFLKDKLVELQDRMPVDWESAGLLVAYLESLVKNNGQIQPGDIVNLLLDAYDPTSSVPATNQDFPDPMSATAKRGLTRRPELDLSLASLGLRDDTNDELASGRSRNGTGRVQTISRAASDAYDNTQAMLRRTVQSIGNPAYPHVADKATERYRHFLLHGQPMKALEHACRSQLWGHAFVLAQRMGPSVVDRVMDRFLTGAVPPTDPLATLYQFTAGQLPQAVHAAAYGQGTDNGDWRAHLAMLISASVSGQSSDLFRSAVEQLGHNLLSRRLVYAAQLCYLLMGPLQCHSTNQYYLPRKICLLGLLSSTSSSATQSASLLSGKLAELQDETSVLNTPTEAIQLTEIYEYAMHLANRNYQLMELMPFKLVYAYRLFDAGLFEKSYHYLTVIGRTILTHSDTLLRSGSEHLCLISLVDNCLRLAEPLHNQLAVEACFDAVTPTHNQRGFLQLQRPEVDDDQRSSDWVVGLRRLFESLSTSYRYFEKLPGDVQPQSSATPVPPSDDGSPSSLPGTRRPSSVRHPSSRQPSESSIPTERPAQLYDRQDQSVRTSADRQDRGGVVGQGHVSADRHQQHQQQHFSQPHQDQQRQQQPQFYGQTNDGGFAGPPPQGQQPRDFHRQQPQNSQLQTEDQQQQQQQQQPQFYAQPNDGGIARSPPQGQQPRDSHRQQQQPSQNSQLKTEPHSNQDRNRQQQYNQAPDRAAPQQQSRNQQPVSDFHMNQQEPASTFAASSPSSPPMQVKPEEAPSVDSINLHSNTNLQHGGAPPTPNVVDSPPSYHNNNRPQVPFFTPAPLLAQSMPQEPSDAQPLQQQHQPFDFFSGMQPMPPPPSRSRSNSQAGADNQYATAPHMSNPSMGQFGVGRDSSAANDDVKPEGASQDGVDGGKSTGGLGDNMSQQQKRGWMSFLTDRFKSGGPQSIHLPDDSKRSIVWDEERKKWIDTTDPKGGDSDAVPPPPPAAAMPAPSASQFVARMPGPPMGGPGGARSRYVNVTPTVPSDPSQTNRVLQPPLPPTAFNSHPAP